MDRLLGPKMGNSIPRILSVFQSFTRIQRPATASVVESRFYNLSITNAALYQLSHAVAFLTTVSSLTVNNVRGLLLYINSNQEIFCIFRNKVLIK